LIANAVEALAPTGGGRIVIRSSRQDNAVIVEIGDDGPGIPPENQPHVWEPFFTTKGVGQGTGMGLHVARRVIVERHHGDINLVSRPGETCFRVRLPIEQQKP